MSVNVDTATQAFQSQATKLLKNRKTTRPASTLAPLMAGFLAWTKALGTEWQDVLEGDYFRGAAFDAWDMESERGWTHPTNLAARVLTETLHDSRPVLKPLPPLDPTHPENLPKKSVDLLALLWRHLDHAWLGAFFGVAYQKLNAHLRPTASGGTIFELLRRSTYLIQHLKTEDQKNRLHIAMVAFKLSVYLEEACGIIQGALHAGKGTEAARRAGWQAPSYTHLTGDPCKAQKVPASEKKAKAPKAPPPFDAFVVAAKLLKKQEISRPVSTLPHLMRKTMDAWKIIKPAGKEMTLPGNMLRNAAFQAWHETTWIRWSAKEQDEIAHVLDHLVSISRSMEAIPAVSVQEGLPGRTHRRDNSINSKMHGLSAPPEHLLPALPIKPPFPLPQEILEACWRHMDILGLRAVWYLQDLGLEPYLPKDRSPFDPLRETVHLTNQVAYRLALADHDADLQSLLLGIAHRLEVGHVMLDQCIETAREKKRRLPTPPSWMRPIYDAADTDSAARMLPSGTDGQSSELPLELRSALAEALQERKCARPLETAIPLVRTYAAWHMAMDFNWRWVPEMDGRECAFMLFESTLAKTHPWQPEQARRLLRITDSLYQLGGKGEMPALPPFESQQPEDASPQVLWRHADRLVCALTLGIMGMGLLPSPPFDSPTSNPQKNLVVHLMDIQAHLFLMLTEWADLKVSERKAALQKASKLLDGFQRIASSILSNNAPDLVELLPIVPYPVVLSVGMPSKPKGKRR